MKHYFLTKVLLYKTLIYFQEMSNVISITETQWPLTQGKENKNDLNFKENDLKLEHCAILKLQLETFRNYFKIRNLYNQKNSQI